MYKNCASFLAAVLVLSAMATTASATLIAFDSFRTDATPNNGDYNSGSIRPQNPTVGLSGFTGDWATASAATGVIVADGGGGLTHPSLPGTPLVGQAVPVFTLAEQSNTRRLFRTINYSPTNGTYYMSFLMKKTVATSVYDMLMGLAPLGTGNYTESSWNTTVGGIYLGIYNGGIGFSSGGGTTTSLLTAANVNVGETYLGLMTINYSTTPAAGSVNVKVYDGASMLAANQTFTGLSLSIPRLSLATDQRNGPSVIVDEFRFGTAVADVFVPVPEPSTMTIVACCLLACFRCRRK